MNEEIKPTRRVLRPQDKKNIALLRFGDLADFNQVINPIPAIGRRLNINYVTVFKFLQRLVKQGERALRDNRFRSRQPDVIVSSDVEILLLSDQYMKKWAIYSLKERVEKIR